DVARRGDENLVSNRIFRHQPILITASRCVSRHQGERFPYSRSFEAVTLCRRRKSQPNQRTAIASGRSDAVRPGLFDGRARLSTRGEPPPQGRVDNGKEYYALQGKTILLPGNPAFRPSTEQLGWHNENRYRP